MTRSLLLQYVNFKYVYVRTNYLMRIIVLLAVKIYKCTFAVRCLATYLNAGLMLIRTESLHAINLLATDFFFKF